MTSSETIDGLNRVLAILERSFTQYLRYARPYIPPGREKVKETLEQIVIGQDALAARVTQTIHDAGGLPDNGEFPIEFTDSHDLAIDYLVDEAIDCQKQDIVDLAACVESLRQSPTAQAMASEALGMARGNLELLQGLSAKLQPAIKSGGAQAFANDPPVSKDATGEPHRQEPSKMTAGTPDSP